VAVDVSGLDDTMFSDTLFGHLKGAFTGAEKNRRGLIEQAEGGTIFLDEIGDLQEQSQIKLLRLLQTSTFYPLGSDRPKECRARIIGAANRKVADLLETSFREDLYYRLSAHQISLPPLREREGDIEILVNHFYDECVSKYNLERQIIKEQTFEQIKEHKFKGNIRELKAMVEDAALRQLTGVEFGETISEKLSVYALPDGAKDSLKSYFGHFPTIKEVNELLLKEAMKEAEGNQMEAASLVGLSRQAFNRRWNLINKK